MTKLQKYQDYSFIMKAIIQLLKNKRIKFSKAKFLRKTSKVNYNYANGLKILHPQHYLSVSDLWISNDSDVVELDAFFAYGRRVIYIDASDPQFNVKFIQIINQYITNGTFNN